MFDKVHGLVGVHVPVGLLDHLGHGVVVVLVVAELVLLVVGLVGDLGVELGGVQQVGVLLTLK